MFNRKKGQAALEFLTTYGWAFLVILVMIAALAYFGILNPTKFLPERCQFGTELHCSQFKLSITEARFQIQNALPDTMTITDVQVLQSDGEYGHVQVTAPLADNGERIGRDAGSTYNLHSQTPIDFSLTHTYTLKEGDRGKIQIKITYYTGTDATYTKEIFGEVYANVVAAI
ncbi:MAG: hypothetical protein V1659_01530 [Candidatus Woesearchaeota archaeon]